MIGYQLATRVEMTQMPELVAIMHSLVGLAALFVGFNAPFDWLHVAGAALVLAGAGLAQVRQLRPLLLGESTNRTGRP